MISFGIMQGRLTPSKGRGIQFFPFDRWEKEFEIGKEIGLDEIEWIMDYDRYQDNPFWTDEGSEIVKSISSDTGVIIRSVCFDYFMRRPFFKAENTEQSGIRNENISFIERTLKSMSIVGANLLEIPFVDNSSIKNETDEKTVIEFVREVMRLANGYGVEVSLETDLPPIKFTQFLDSISNDIHANYDSGNSSGLGYQHDAEILSLGGKIANVHIKDRVLHGTTVKLGTGSADFELVFGSLKDIGYSKSIILQAARGDDGLEKDNIVKQLQFVKEYCKKYGLG